MRDLTLRLDIELGGVANLLGDIKDEYGRLRSTRRLAAIERDPNAWLNGLRRAWLAGPPGLRAVPLGSAGRFRSGED